MNLAFLITGLGMGGAERQVLALADQFSAMGHKVLVIFLSGESAISPSRADVKVIGIGMKKTPRSFLFSLIMVKKLLLNFHPDVVHSHMVHANIFARLLRLICKIPRLICTAHSINEGGCLRMLGYRLTDGLADLSTNVSQEAVQAFLASGAAKSGRMIAMYNGIDENEFKFSASARYRTRQELGVDDDMPLLLAVGRLIEAKDYPNLLHAFARVSVIYPGSRLAIVGVGSLLLELQALSFELGVSSRVLFLGLRRDIPALMSASDLFVLSSAWEGFGLVVAEAMACKRMVVATDCGGVREVMGDTGILVPPRNPSALSEAIELTLKLSETDRDSRGEAARLRVVNNYTLSKVAGRWLELYRGGYVN